MYWYCCVDCSVAKFKKKMKLWQDPDVMSLLGDDASDASQLTNITTCSEGSNISFMPSKGIDSISQSEYITISGNVKTV